MGAASLEIDVPCASFDVIRPCSVSPHYSATAYDRRGSPSINRPGKTFVPGHQVLRCGSVHFPCSSLPRSLQILPDGGDVHGVPRTSFSM